MLVKELESYERQVVKFTLELESILDHPLAETFFPKEMIIDLKKDLYEIRHVKKVADNK